MKSKEAETEQCAHHALPTRRLTAGTVLKLVPCGARARPAPC